MAQLVADHILERLSERRPRREADQRADADASGVPQPHAPEWEAPRTRRTALVHGHCHQEAIMGLDAERALFDRIGLDFEVLDSGCCGLAGSFGFEREHHEISVAIGERTLLPAVHEAGDETILIADGFSCRTQIEQLTNRGAPHTAQVLGMAIG